MTRPPTDVLTERLQRAIGGREVRAAMFTTFRFEPAFFEQEILTALFDVSWHHVPRLRIMQFEGLLPPLSGKVAVYYDHRALVEGDLGSAALDVRRIPCWPRTGYFHPKVVFVLVDGALVLMISSANLTRAGWWENVEAAAIEEIRDGQPTRSREELLAFTNHLRTQTRDVREHEALDAVRAFLRGTVQTHHRTGSGRIHTHFFANGRANSRAFADFMSDTTRGAVNGWSLDVISPYVDDTTTSQPLAKLVETFHPRSVRVVVPEHDGLAACTKELYDDVQQNGWQWSRLPATMMVRSEAARASARTVHAKVYRFFDGTREVVFVGSINLTTAGHQSTGNIEAGVLLERRHERQQTHWLVPVDEPPAFFDPKDEGEEVDDFTPRLALRYDWSRKELAALWAMPGENPRLRLRAHGVALLDIDVGTLPRDEWQELVAIDGDRLREHLATSSFLTAVADDGREGILLVLEVGMAHRPSVLLQLTPAEILQYWALLSPQQRAEYIGVQGERLPELEGGEAVVARLRAASAPESMFDRFAGMFHGFASLERKIADALEARRNAEAEFLVVGAKPDSLRRLIDAVAERKDDETLVDDYLLLLCAEQLVRRIQRDWPEFWKQTAGTRELQEALEARKTVRSAIAGRGDPEIERFLDWHEKKFLRPVRRSA